MTQAQVARLLGTSKSAISRLEGDFRHRPTLSTIENYALVVRCRVEITLRPWP
jgi:transcriptional regulator with XRE-family HTH domain